MKSDSLLSQISNLSKISNLSHLSMKRQNEEPQYFRDSLSFIGNKILNCYEIKQEYIQLESLGFQFFQSRAPNKETTNAFSLYWTNDFPNNIEGISDNQDGQHHKIKIQCTAKVQQCQQSYKKIYDTRLKKSEDVNLQISEQIMKNETKNIPKNYGKAIIIFIQKNKDLIQEIIVKNGDNYNDLLLKLKSLKKKINTISDLRDLWQSHSQSKSVRIISNYFLRKHSLSYIYNSRIKTRLCHSKYKRRLQQAILNPKEFNHIKNY